MQIGTKMASNKYIEPTVLDLDQVVEQHEDYRTIVWTGEHLQMTSMVIERANSIGLEVHPDTDQMLLVQQGKGMAFLSKSKRGKPKQVPIQAGQAVMVPAGVWHNILNTGRSKLRIVSLYAPPHHHE